jgi:hypothetical protein
MRLTVLDPCTRLPARSARCWRSTGLAMLDDAIRLAEFTPGDRLTVGPFAVRSWLLPHSVPNAGLRPRLVAE